MSLGVYISYPLCAQKCTFCNFASDVFPRGFEAEYLEALRREISAAPWAESPDTVYLGGGTPSQMDPQNLAAILRVIPGYPWKEATLEASPGTLTPEKIGAWRAAGINRISLGVQSFSTPELSRTGRKHTAETVVQELAMLRATGIPNVNIDLIAGLPGQTAETWQSSLSWLNAIDAPHVSVYMLEVDEDSRLGKEVLFHGKRYGAPDVPSDEAVAGFYNQAVRHLKALGIHRYEISNFAKPGMESAHNLKYWRLEPYAGFGADAHSFDGLMRSQNIDSPQEYIDRMRASGTARIACDPSRLAEEKFFVGLRLSDGITPSAEEWRHWRQPIRQFVADGLLEQRGERLRLTDRGILFSNEVLAEFVEA